jgi:hypothetical protein
VLSSLCDVTEMLVSPLQSPNKSNVESQATVPHSSRAAWPYRYACDMANGFRHFEQLRLQGISTQTAFEQSFIGARWKRSTFSDNLRVWNQTPTAEMSGAIDKGRAVGGEWNQFSKKHGKRRN